MADPERFDADPDPIFHADADPDPDPLKILYGSGKMMRILWNWH